MKSLNFNKDKWKGELTPALEELALCREYRLTRNGTTQKAGGDRGCPTRLPYFLVVSKMCADGAHCLPASALASSRYD